MLFNITLNLPNKKGFISIYFKGQALFGACCLMKAFDVYSTPLLPLWKFHVRSCMDVVRSHTHTGNYVRCSNILYQSPGGLLVGACPEAFELVKD